MHAILLIFKAVKHQYNLKYSFITITITMSIMLANFGKYAISDCPFICLSVCPSVRPSVCLSVTPFWLCSHHCIIMKFSGVITTDQGNVHAKGQGQRSKVKVTTQLDGFRTVTPIWIHIWWWNDAYSLMLLRRGALLFFKVNVKFQGHTALKIVEFDLD